MPNIREYNNTVDAPSGSGRQASAAARGGEAQRRGLSSFGEQVGGTIARVGTYYKEKTDAAETSAAAAAMATASSELSVEWNQIAKSTDPNQIEQAAQDFHEKRVGPMLEKIGGSLNSDGARNFFTRSSAALKGGLFEKTSADASSLAGVASVSNALTVNNQLSNALKNDPSMFTTALSISKLATQALVKSHGLPVEKAIELDAKFEQSYAQSAALGMIERNPEQAKTDIADGRFEKFLDAAQIETLQRRADQAVRAQTEQERAAKAEQVRQQKEQFTRVTNEVMATTLDPQTGQLRVPPNYFKNVIQMKDLAQADDSTIRAMVSFGNTITADMEKGTPVATDPYTYQDFRARAFLPDTDPRKLTTAEVLQARADHKLNDKDFTFWNGAVNSLSKDEGSSAQQRDFTKFLNSYKGYITDSSFLKVDAFGDQRFYEWSARAQQMHDEMSARKVPEKDIRAAIVNALPQFQVSDAANRGSYSQRAKGGLQPLPSVTVPKRNPGESAADFLKRTGG